MIDLIGGKCKHPKVAPDFSDDMLADLGVAEIRAKYPRFDGVCPDCKQKVIIYSSFLHYIAGGY